jgi:hypothetical protein
MTKTVTAAERWVADMERDTILYIRRPRWKRGKHGETLDKQNSRWLANEEEIMRLVCVVAGLATHSKKLSVHAWTPTNDYRKDKHALAKARAVISPHGGQMGNILFAPPGTLVVELIDVVTGNLCFLGLSRMLGFDYEAVTPTTYGHNQHAVWVNAEWVIAALAKHIPQLRDGLLANGILRRNGSLDMLGLEDLVPTLTAGLAVSHHSYCWITETSNNSGNIMFPPRLTHHEGR